MSATIPAGYKLTEVGVIPDDWDAAPLGRMASIERGKFSARPRNDARFYGGAIPFIQTGDVTRSGGTITTFTQTLNNDGLRVSRLFPTGTLFFTIAANIGDVGIAQFEVACPDSLVAITPNPLIDKVWLLYELSRRKTDFENLASPGAQLNINLEKLRPYLLPVPPLPEQRAIATALSDVDALLAKLDQLITKKCDLKQAAMQQLLTGRTRLPGFDVHSEFKHTEVGMLPSDWDVLTISVITNEFHGGAPFKPADFTDSGVKVLPKGGVGRTGKLCVAERDIQYCSQEYAEKHSRNQVNKTFTIVVLRDLVPSGPSIGLMVEIEKDETFVLAQGVYGFRVNESLADARYLIQLSNTNWYRRLVNSIMVGSTQVHITNTAFKKARIPLPQLSEQTAIATVLSDMDTELAALQARRDKTHAVKQGMMQELLTGRIRLV